MSPHFSVDSQGGILVADAQEARITKYGRDGVLTWKAGRRGKGPGEYQVPTMVVRAPSGNLLVLDAFNGISERSPDGSAEVRLIKPKLVPLYSIVAIGHNEVVVGAHGEGQARSQLLHWINLDSETTVRSALNTPGDTVAQSMAGVFGSVALVRRGNRFGVVAALVDTLYIVDTSGDLAGSMQLPFTEFRRATMGPPKAQRTSREFREWLGSFERILDIAWTPSGYVVAQAGRATDRGPVFRTVVVDSAGRKVVEIDPSPRLIGSIDDTLMFQDPQVETPNGICLATITDLAQSGK